VVEHGFENDRSATIVGQEVSRTLYLQEDVVVLDVIGGEAGRHATNRTVRITPEIKRRHPEIVRSAPVWAAAPYIKRGIKR
jgi:hypothetical protein